MFGFRHEGSVGREAEEEGSRGGGGGVSGRVGGEGNSQGGKKEGDQDTRTEKLVEVNIDFILSRVCPSNWALELGVKIQTGCKQGHFVLLNAE